MVEKWLEFFYQFPLSNWTTTVVSIANPQFHLQESIDSNGRNWSMIDVEFSSPLSNVFEIGSFAIGYNLFENVQD